MYLITIPAVPNTRKEETKIKINHTNSMNSAKFAKKKEIKKLTNL